MIKFGSLKNVEVKRVKIRDWVWVMLVSGGSATGLLLVDWYARTR